MGTKTVFTCDKCGEEVTDRTLQLCKWRSISQGWIDGRRIGANEVILCPVCFERSGLRNLFYPDEEG